MANGICKLCNSIINLDEFDMNREIPQLMMKDHLCYSCAFWINRLKWDKSLKEENKISIVTPDFTHWISPKFGQKLLISTGNFYSIPLSSTLYSMAVLLDHQDFVLIQNNNLNHQGVIPVHLRDHFKVNGIFLTPMHWKQLQDTKNVTYEYLKNLIDKSSIL